MIEETARVVRVDGAFAFIETEQRASCGTCQSQGSCGTKFMAGLFKRRTNLLKVPNALSVQPGDEVVIGLREGAFLKISLLAYIFPLFTMILMAILAQFLSGYFAFTSGELPQVVGGLLGLIGGFFLIKRLTRIKRHDQDYQVTILRHADRVSVPFV